jgi:MFS family permease
LILTSVQITLAYLASYLLSVLGNAVSAIALPLIILQTTGSALGAGVVAGAVVLPAVAAGIFMGVVIDRVNRRTSSIVTDLVSGASLAALPLTALFTDLNVAIFVLFGVIGALGDIPGITARETLLPAVVREGWLSAERIVGLRESLGAAVLVVGPAIAGLLVAFLDATSILWVTAGAFLAAAGITLFIPHQAGATDSPAAAPPGRVWSALKEGVRAISRNAVMVTLLALTFGAGIVTSSFQGLILPLYFTGLGRPEIFGFVLSALAAGLLLGSGVYAALATPGRARRRWLSAGLIGAAFGIATMATLASVPVILVGAFVTGCATGLFTSIAGVLMLENIPDHVRGRVMSVQNAAVTVAPSLGILIASVLAHNLGVGFSAMVAAGIWVVVTIAVLTSTSMRHLDTAVTGAPSRI